MGILEQVDTGVFKRAETWKAFAIAAIMFVTISFAALSMFDSMDEIFQSDAEPVPVPNMVFESLNRSEYESSIANETGWINLDNMIGDIIILDFMARDCSNCHAVQNHLEDNIAEWEQLANQSNKTLTVIAYGSWYSESIEYLNQSAGVYHVPYYATGLGTTNSAILEDGSTADPVRLFTTAGTGQIPVVMVLDEEGYIIAKQSTGTPTDQWKDFDSVVEDALTGSIEDTIDLRLSLIHI